MKSSSAGFGPSTGLKTEMTYDVLNCHPDQPDVKELFTTKCLTVEEKYRLLEVRDKVLRARIPKVKVRVEFATRLFGTCLDMCPEKERYMRQYQRQLTSFEIDHNSQDLVVDHRRAIKAYSRSSADQDEPLPHDLRPGPTLEMALNYLLHHIVPMGDLNEDVLGDWYNFLWDRTRSIRKDITQQQLTDLRVVSLMEKCTRLHIHCSSRLCELDVHLFDPKLNDENLMKCLQSLEHLYDDLRRRDVKCPNEPEFRAYQLMMNLNEGDILLSVQQRPEWILKSAEVQVAIKLHHYIYSKNFVAFFRLVKSLPYMFSCISHRYFYQVRHRALSSMCRSSSAKKGDVQLILSQVQRMLGFGEDPSVEFQNFCDIHGLLVDIENNRILYNRRRYMRPDSTVINREAYLIEAKLITTTAEAINGGPLTENPLLTYKPHNSFDAEGFLKPGLVAGESSGSDAGVVSKPGQRFVTENSVNDDDAFAAAALRKTRTAGFMKRKPAAVFKSPSVPEKKPSIVFKSPSLMDKKSTLEAAGKSSPFDSPPSVAKHSTFGSPLAKSSTFESPLGRSSAFETSSGKSSSFEAPSITDNNPSIFKSPFAGMGVFSGGSFGENQPLFGGSSVGLGSSASVPVPLLETSASNVFGNLSMPKPLFGGNSVGFGGSTSAPLPETGASNVFGNINMPKPLFGGNSVGFGSSKSAPETGAFSIFGNTSLLQPPAVIPTIFVSQPAADLEFLAREARDRKLQLIDTACNATLDKMLQQIIEQELQLSVQTAIQKNTEEKEFQEKLLRKEEIRSRMSEQAAERVIARVVPFWASNIVQEEVQRHRWLQSVCELYANKAIESLLTLYVEPICTSQVSQHRAEYEYRLRRATAILKRLQLRLILHKWLAFAKAKQHARWLKKEQLLQDMINFPASNPVGQSPQQMLQHLRGNGISPNIIKTNMSTKTFLDKYERAEHLAENFRNSVSTYVMEQYKKSPGPSLTDLETEASKRKTNQEYKNHCWKRRWSTTLDPSETEADNTKFGGRKSKSPRQEFTNHSHKSPKIKSGQEGNHLQNSEKSEADLLLEEIKKFTEDARREKENYIKSELKTASQSGKYSLNSFPHINGNLDK